MVTKMKNTYSMWLIILGISLSLLTACGTSTGSRYSKSDTSDEQKSDQSTEVSIPKDLIEDFDISPYKSKIELKDKKPTSASDNKEIWFEYNSSSKDYGRKILSGTADGYRILVTSTDNLEEANQIKADVFGKLDRNEIYIDFDPPFYKVKVGDFNDQKTADNLRFKLNQLGYKEAKVIKDKINTFK